jgi:hypothetical protein
LVGLRAASKPLHRWLLRGLEMPEIEMPLRRGAPGLEGLRIAFISDVHAGSCMGECDLMRLFAKVEAAEPDLVCLGGDLINTRERELLLFREPLRLLHPPLGIYAVPGNHDHFWGPDIGLWTAFLQECGVEVLSNEGRRIERDGASLWLAGVDDLTEGQPDLPLALQGMRADEPCVLLAHHPDFFFEAAAIGVDVQLSGTRTAGRSSSSGTRRFSTVALAGTRGASSSRVRSSTSAAVWVSPCCPSDWGLHQRSRCWCCARLSRLHSSPLSPFAPQPESTAMHEWALAEGRPRDRA